MPAKALTRSAVSPAGPVTKVCMPSGADACTSSRSSVTTSFTSPAESIGTTNCTALPSSDGMGPMTVLPAPTASSLPLRAAASPSWAGVKAESLSMTMTAGISLVSRNLACQSWAAVASAPAGRKDAWSFEETSLQPAEGGSADPGDGQPGDDQQDGNQPAQPEGDAGTGVVGSCSWFLLVVASEE